MRRLIAQAVAPILPHRVLVPVAGALSIGVAEDRQIVMGDQGALRMLGEYEHLAGQIFVVAQRQIRHAAAQQELEDHQEGESTAEHKRQRGDGFGLPASGAARTHVMRSVLPQADASRPMKR